MVRGSLAAVDACGGRLRRHARRLRRHRHRRCRRQGHTAVTAVVTTAVVTTAVVTTAEPAVTATTTEPAAATDSDILDWADGVTSLLESEQGMSSPVW